MRRKISDRKMSSFSFTRRDLLVAGVAQIGAGGRTTSGQFEPPRVDGARVSMNEKAYVAIGCNYFNALNARSRRGDFMRLGERRIPFIRLNFGQFWPGDSLVQGWRLYFED